MGNWTDPDVKKHVIGDTSQRYKLFLEPFTFYSSPTKKYTPFMLKDMHSVPNIIYYGIDNERREKHITNLREDSPKYRFAYTSNHKPMQDAFFAIGQVYLYQILLGINKLWNTLEYEYSNIPKVLVPNKSIITNLFRDLLTQQNFKQIQELTQEPQIRRAIQRLIVDIDIDYHLSEIISEKLHIPIEDVVRRLKSPLIVKYLSRTITKMINITDVPPIKVLENTLDTMLKKVTVFIKDNRNDAKGG